jgi:hypothetical protein
MEVQALMQCVQIAIVFLSDSHDAICVLRAAIGRCFPVRHVHLAPPSPVATLHLLARITACVASLALDAGAPELPSRASASRPAANAADDSSGATLATSSRTETVSPAAWSTGRLEAGTRGNGAISFDRGVGVDKVDGEARRLLEVALGSRGDLRCAINQLQLLYVGDVCGVGYSEGSTGPAKAAVGGGEQDMRRPLVPLCEAAAVSGVSLEVAASVEDAVESPGVVQSLPPCPWRALLVKVHQSCTELHLGGFAVTTAADIDSAVHDGGSAVTEAPYVGDDGSVGTGGLPDAAHAAAGRTSDGSTWRAGNATGAMCDLIGTDPAMATAQDAPPPAAPSSSPQAACCAAAVSSRDVCAADEGMARRRGQLAAAAISAQGLAAADVIATWVRAAAARLRRRWKGPQQRMGRTRRLDAEPGGVATGVQQPVEFMDDVQPGGRSVAAAESASPDSSEGVKSSIDAACAPGLSGGADTTGAESESDGGVRRAEVVTTGSPKVARLQQVLGVTGSDDESLLPSPTRVAVAAAPAQAATALGGAQGEPVSASVEHGRSSWIAAHGAAFEVGFPAEGSDASLSICPVTAPLPGVRERPLARQPAAQPRHGCSAPPSMAAQLMLAGPQSAATESAKTSAAAALAAAAQHLATCVNTTATSPSFSAAQTSSCSAKGAVQAVAPRARDGSTATRFKRAHSSNEEDLSKAPQLVKHGPRRPRKIPATGANSLSVQHTAEKAHSRWAAAVLVHAATIRAQSTAHAPPPIPLCTATGTVAVPSAHVDTALAAIERAAAAAEGASALDAFASRLVHTCAPAEPLTALDDAHVAASSVASAVAPVSELVAEQGGWCLSAAAEALDSYAAMHWAVHSGAGGVKPDHGRPQPQPQLHKDLLRSVTTMVSEVAIDTRTQALRALATMASLEVHKECLKGGSEGPGGGAAALAKRQTRRVDRGHCGRILYQHNIILAEMAAAAFHPKARLRDQY